MKPQFLFVLVCALFIAPSWVIEARAQDPPKSEEPAIDFEKARAILRKERAGEKLSKEERSYLERAKALRRNQQGGRPGAARSRQRPAPERLIPLTDMDAEDRYGGEDGGLYGGGRNSPPEKLAKAAAAALAKIQPLDAAGKPDPDGRVVFVSISMSNATQEFSRFKQLLKFVTTDPLAAPWFAAPQPRAK